MPNAKPNILVILGDDIGMWNVGAYTHGMMGDTPNIDRIAREGCIFTDHYGQPSYTAGRAAFLMGQLPVRTGITPDRHSRALTRGHPEGGPDASPRCSSRPATRPASSARTTRATGTSSCRPSAAFDEWFGNLYHLNAEEEPEELDYPGQKNPEYLKKYGPRGVLHAWATDEDNPTEVGIFAPRGKQKIENTGPLAPHAHGNVRQGSARQDDRLARPQQERSPSSAGSTPRAVHIFSHPAAEAHPDGGRPRVAPRRMSSAPR